MRLDFKDIGNHQTAFFALGDLANLKKLPTSALGKSIHLRNSADPKQARFAFLFNIFNGSVYGDVMGMPPWVMINCIFQNAALIGIEGPAKYIPVAMREKIDTALAEMNSDHLKDDEIVPLAEACAIKTFAPDRVHAFSLYSTTPGLGSIAKAAMLDIHRQMGARYQTGTAQYDNASLAIHTKFGALDILQPQVALHTKHDRTFIYGCEIPDEAALLSIAMGHRPMLPGELKPEAIIQFDWRELEQYQNMTQRHENGSHRYVMLPPGIDAVTKTNPIAEIKL
ncbi:MAG TPA: hypothetical protein PKW15_01250 [Alphaproteobacteria bacterium]|nr:hypothetical protein [Rhodospirillaceae bacterium]HRJ11849.1 hypothetical protein [Alphaproteobacteria bacterium]